MQGHRAFGLIALACVASVRSNECTDACDQAYPGGIEVTLCGTDFNTYTTHQDALSEQCYFDCQITSYYAGPCGCPNSCYSDFSQGTCSNGQCLCSKGWTGADCNQPTYENVCSYHGKLTSQTAYPQTYCKCDDGFTGMDCSSPVFDLGNAPWGSIYGGEEYHGDKYQDNHPVFNSSVMATIHVTLPVAAFLDQLYTWNTYNNTYTPASFHFDNGNFQSSLSNVGLSLKGAWSRVDQKKGWHLKFNEFTSKQDFQGMKKMGLKPGSDDDDTFLKNILYKDFQRASEVPVPRASYALLYVNEVFYGLYTMTEDVDETFIKGRYKDDDGNGNLYKMNTNVNLKYFGDDVNYYQTAHKNYPSGDVYYSYEQASGNGDWTDLVDILAFANQTSDADFAKDIASRMDLNMLMHGLVVESFLLNADGFTEGNNYFFYHSHNQDHPAQFSLFNNDFDQAFYFTALGQPRGDPNIFTYAVVPPTDGDFNPYLSRIFAIQQYRDLYVQCYATFLNEVFGSGSRQQPAVRHAALLQFVLPWVAKDKIWEVSEGVTVQSFIEIAESTNANLLYRYKDTFKQVQEYLTAGRKL